MPSDPRLLRAAEAFAPLFAQYQSTLAATLEDIRSRLQQQTSSDRDGASRLKTELGEFAVGRIDTERLSGLLGRRPPLAPAAIQRLERAAAILTELAARGDQLMHLQVAAGDDLVATVRTRCAQIGRAFAAARLAATATDAKAISESEERGVTAMPFSQWSAAERRLAPPLVVSVNGNDFRPAGLAEFLDGLQKIVIMVDGEAPVAGLVRLITPGVFVAQSTDASVCARIAEWPGSAIAAVVPTSCAQFVHDPSAGPELWQRVRVVDVPSPSTRVGGFTTAQQTEEVRQLEALVHRPVAAACRAGTGEPDVDSVDRIAAWLLRQADVIEPAEGH